MSLVLSKQLVAQMEAHALSTYPNECCGFLFGDDKGSDRFIREVNPVINHKAGDQRRRFEINPLDYLKAERYALEQPVTLLGIYHSHPDHPAQPSDHDLKQALPFFSYVILSVDKNTVMQTTSWQLHEDRFIEENIVINNEVESLN